MAADISPAGRHGSSELRASHADRDQVVEKLRVAAGDGRLTPEELDERLEAALTAKTYADLAALTADLPAVRQPAGVARQPRDLLRFDRRGGNVRQSGHWAVPARIEADVRGGNVRLDLTEAVVTYPTLDVEADVRGGSLVLVIKPGIAVDANDMTMIGGNVKFRSGANTPGPVTLHVALSGQVRGGNVVVRLPRRTFWAWLTGKPRPYPATA
jgi:Domain of unknown function (DUF1707)